MARRENDGRVRVMKYRDISAERAGRPVAAITQSWMSLKYDLAGEK
jgi:hypothetical protein